MTDRHLTRPESLTRPIARMRNDNVLIRVESRREQEGYQGTIHLPDIDVRGRSQDLAKIPMWGRVVLVGPKAEGEVRVGERVLTNRMAGDVVYLDGEEHRVVRLAALVVAEELTFEKDCRRCDGCGRIASGDEGAPWTRWEKLPLGSCGAVAAGFVRPVPCPACGGTGKAVVG